jgi:hypothetical protein
MLKEIEHLYLQEALEIDPGKKDVKGDNKKDQNGDGDNNFEDVMIARMMKSGMSREEAIEYVNKEYKVKPKVKVDEGFSDWRTDLREVLDDLEADIENAQIKKKNVNNYGGKDKAVNLNPTLGQVAENFGGQILDEYELTEEYIDAAIEIATNYFIEQGLNDEGVELVVEDVGLDTFVDFVFDLAEESILTEARAATKRKGGKSYEEVKAEIDAKEKAAAEKRAQRAASVKTKVTRDKVAVSTEKAKKAQPSARPEGQERVRKAVGDAVKTATSPEAKKAVGKVVKGGLDVVARAGLSAWEGHKEAMKSKESGQGVGKQLASGATKALGSFFKKGTAHFKEWVEGLINEGYDLSEYSELDLKIAYLEEMAISEQQQKL